jgi:hypothetical protein
MEKTISSTPVKSESPKWIIKNDILHWEQYHKNSITYLVKRNYDQICQDKFEDVKNESCENTDSDLHDNQLDR